MTRSPSWFAFASVALPLVLAPLPACFRDLTPQGDRGDQGPADGSELGDGEQDRDAGPDRQASSVVITAAPSAPLLTPTARFAFSCSEPPCAFRCQVDDDAFADCTSPFETRGLLPGDHRFAVQNGAEQPLSKPFSIRFPYSIVGAERPLVAKPEGYVNADFRCTRIDVAWQGEDVLEMPRPDPFQCPMEYWLERIGVGEAPDYGDAQGATRLYLNTTGPVALHTRLKKPKDDPAPWPSDTVLEQVLTIEREPIEQPAPPADDAGVPDAGDEFTPPGAERGAFSIERPIVGNTCPSEVNVNLYGEPKPFGATLQLGMAATAPPSEGQTSTSCSVRVPVVLASGWNVAKVLSRVDGAAYGGAALRYTMELGDERWFDARVEPGVGGLAFPVQAMNWEPCPVERELTIRFDFENLTAMQDIDVAIYLDLAEFGLETQGVFGWQTCSP